MSDAVFKGCGGKLPRNLRLLFAVCLLQQAKLRNNDVISAEMTCMTFGHLFCKVVVSRYLFLTVLGSWWIHKGLASSYWSSHTEVSSGEMLPGKGSQHERVGSPYSWLRWLFWGLGVWCFPCGIHQPFLSTCDGWDSPVLRRCAQIPSRGCLQLTGELFVHAVLSVTSLCEIVNLFV